MLSDVDHIPNLIPGFINYKYKDGKIPGHTKSKFTQYKILTIHGIIVQNALIFMHKFYNYPSLLPPAIIETISTDSPIQGSNHELCESWLRIYNNHLYRNTLFFKGPLLVATSKINENLPLASFITIKAYKTNVKQALLTIQSSGETCDWKNYNFPLYNIEGLRKSEVSYRSQVDYTEN